MLTIPHPTCRKVINSIHVKPVRKVKSGVTLALASPMIGEVLPTWDDIEELEDRLEEAEAEFEKERIEFRRGNSFLVRKLEAAQHSKKALVKIVQEMKAKLT